MARRQPKILPLRGLWGHGRPGGHKGAYANSAPTSPCSRQLLDPMPTERLECPLHTAPLMDTGSFYRHCSVSSWN